MPPLLPPLLHLAPGCVPLSQGNIVFNLVREADEHDGIAYSYPGLACFEAFKDTTGHESGQVSDIGHRELPQRPGRHGDIYPRWSHAAGRRCGVTLCGS